MEAYGQCYGMLARDLGFRGHSTQLKLACDEFRIVSPKLLLRGRHAKQQSFSKETYRELSSSS